MVELSNRFYDSTIQRFNHLTIFLFAFSVVSAAHAQFPQTETARSTSGQFVVTGGREISPLATLRIIATNADFVRLQPALLAVSAEHFKESFRRELGIGASESWNGKIFLALHPAQSSDENINIISIRFDKGWNYRVELPDVVLRARLERALTGVLLLELANRDAQSRPAEIPAWLTDGLARQLSATGLQENLLTLPDKTVNNISIARLTNDASGIDPMAAARKIFENSPALTFGQLSWPDDAQVSGADGGAYLASAQLFVSEILKLKNGPADLRAMLETLPQFYNWQTAFQNAFRENFPTPLDVEKWWALQVVDFAAHNPGPQWTPGASRDALDEILRVPVEMRDASNSLPARAEISLQAAIRNFDPAQQSPILQTKLRDLQLARLHMAGPLAVLTADYCRALENYLDENSVAPTSEKRAQPSSQKFGANETLKKLDALDARRRTMEDAVKTVDSAPGTVNLTGDELKL